MTHWTIQRTRDEKTLCKEDDALRAGFEHIKTKIFDLLEKSSEPLSEEDILTALSGQIDPVSLGIVLGMLRFDGSIALVKKTS